jgi:hypothetical protein
MIVAVDGAAGSVAVYAPDDFARLHVEAASLEQACAVPGISPAGEGADVWLSIPALRSWFAEPTPEWEDGFEKMIAAAGRAGWLDESASQVRAHLELREEERS